MCVKLLHRVRSVKVSFFSFVALCAFAAKATDVTYTGGETVSTALTLEGAIRPSPCRMARA